MYIYIYIYIYINIYICIYGSNNCDLSGSFIKISITKNVLRKGNCYKNYVLQRNVIFVIKKFAFFIP